MVLQCKRESQSNPPGGARVLQACAVLTALLITGPVFSQRTLWPDAPHWFWTQTSEGLLGPNIAMDWISPTGYRLFCWRSALNGTFGVGIPPLPAKELTRTSFVPLNDAVCKILIARYGAGS